MTMQVGMRGCDGVLLAGDTKQYIESQGKAWHAYSSPKIRISDTRRIAIACARDMHTSTRIAEEVFTRVAISEPWNRVSQIKEIGIRVASGYDAECIIAFADPSPSLVLFLCDKNGNARCEEIYDSVPAGDVGNPAYFWAMRYYRSDLTVRQLTCLAAHIIVAAGKLNSGSIAGLEIVTCGEDGFRRWSEEENQELESKTKKLEIRIGALILEDDR